MAVTRKCGNEALSSTKCGEFHDWLRTGKILKKESDPWST